MARSDTRAAIPAILLATLLWLTPLWARVYSLKPGVGRSSVESVLRTRQVLEDKIDVNGEQGKLQVGVTDLSLADALAHLKGLLLNYRHAASPSSILIETPPRRGMVTRYYILSMGERYKTLVFTMQIPQKALAKKSVNEWPRHLPQPRGAIIEPALKLGKHNLTMASFSAAAPPVVVYRDYDSLLRQDGWERLTGDQRQGGVYSRDNKQILVLNVIEDDRRTRAAVVVRDIK